MLSQIIWDVSPVIFTLGPLSVRWYGLAFAVGFIVGYNIVAKMFKHEARRRNGLEYCWRTLW